MNPWSYKGSVFLFKQGVNWSRCFLCATMLSMSNGGSAATMVWRGNHDFNNNWSAGQNWTTDYQISLGNVVVPSSGDSLEFQGVKRTSSINNLTNYSFTDINFNSGFGPFTLNGNAITLTGSVNNNSSSTQTFNLAALSFATTRTINAAAGDILMNSKIQGSGGVTKNGSHDLYFNGANAYTGSTAINYGALIIGNGSQGSIQASSATTIGVSGTLELNLGTGTTFANAVNNSGAMKMKQSGSSTLSGNLDGSGNLYQAGLGTTIISGVKSFSGSTTVSAGLLSIHSSGSLGNSSIAVSSGGELQVNGVSGDVVVQSGGVISGSGRAGSLTLQSNSLLKPGNSPGNLTVASSVWNSGAKYAWQITSPTGTAGTQWDLLTVDGNLNLANLTTASRFNLALDSGGSLVGFNPSQTYSWTFAMARSLTLGTDYLGTSDLTSLFNIDMSALNTGGSNPAISVVTGTANVNGISYTTLNLTTVPEPSVLTLIIAGLGGMALGRRRRQ
jgi:autotransporter-associated beta strand protein